MMNKQMKRDTGSRSVLLGVHALGLGGTLLRPPAWHVFPGGLLDGHVSPRSVRRDPNTQ